jgi:hypothetical protein
MVSIWYRNKILVMKANLLYILITAALCSCLELASAQDHSPDISFCYGYFPNDINVRTIGNDRTYLAGPVTCKFEFGAKHSKATLQLSLGYLNCKWGSSHQSSLYEDSTWKTITTVLSNRLDVYSLLVKANCYVVSTKRFDGFVSFGGGFQIIKFRLDSLYPPAATMEDSEYGFPWAIKYNLPILFDVTMGIRYKLLPHLALYCETGYSKASLQIGLSSQLQWKSKETKQP